MVFFSLMMASTCLTLHYMWSTCGWIPSLPGIPRSCWFRTRTFLSSCTHSLITWSLWPCLDPISLLTAFIYFYHQARPLESRRLRFGSLLSTCAVCYFSVPDPWWVRPFGAYLGPSGSCFYWHSMECLKISYPLSVQNINFMTKPYSLSNRYAQWNWKLIYYHSLSVLQCLFGVDAS